MKWRGEREDLQTLSIPPLSFPPSPVPSFPFADSQTLGFCVLMYIESVLLRDSGWVSLPSPTIRYTKAQELDRKD
jgi:hypothetical protein